MKHFRAEQVLRWVYERGVIDPNAMSDLALREREMLAREMTFASGSIVATQSASDGTRKLLIEWDEQPSREARAIEHHKTSASLPILGAPDSTAGTGALQTECVMIPSLPESPGRPRRTACISSQVGCPVGCKFCASGIGGLDGNLSTGRIVEQVWRLQRLLAGDAIERGENAASAWLDNRITNVVFMGMGEPLANFRAVTGAVRTLAAPWGMGISARRITISTVGLPQAITRLAEELELPVTLALSLHAPTDEVRRSLIPWAEYTTIEELLSACHKWFQKTGREVTLEYTLLRGVNDHAEHAELLAGLAKKLRANINLIRYNEVSGMPFKRPQTDDVREFQRILRERGINAHIRASRGRDIAAACGQLRHESAKAD